MTLRLGFVALVLLVGCRPEGPHDRQLAAAKFAAMFKVAPYTCDEYYHRCSGLREGKPVGFWCGGGTCQWGGP